MLISHKTEFPSTPIKHKHQSSSSTNIQSTYSSKSQNQSCGSIGSNSSWNISMVDHINPYMITPFKRQISDIEQIQMTDRYIPSRKLLKKQSFYEEQSDDDDRQNNYCEPADSGVRQVSDLYKKLIISNSNNKQKCFDVFTNSNILKYSKYNNQLNTNSLLQGKKSTTYFTNDMLTSTNTDRKISKLPCKVLDAPAIQDDYYLNLIDWSTQNFLSVGLGPSVYLWNANNSKVTKLCDLGAENVTSVSWCLKGPFISIGTSVGEVKIWDVNKMRQIRNLEGHNNRVGSMCWNSTVLSSGSRDKNILDRDIRCSQNFVRKLEGHKQQVCGLKWSFDEQQLCSGGNDNKLLIWGAQSNMPILKFNDHAAAVKAVAWSPHQHGLLASGGGTADRTIRFRNTLTGLTTNSIDVGSQVCNLLFSKTTNQLVSTHGFSENQINIWQYPKIKKVQTLKGHTMRVLYLAMSPDGKTIVTGAGDQTLRFWNAFPHRQEGTKKPISELQISSTHLR